MTAAPKPGWAFKKWTDGAGNLVPGPATLALSMDSNRTLKAVFLSAQWSLTMSAEVGGGTIPAVGVHYYLANDVVSVSAVNADGMCFAHWFGAPVADTREIRGRFPYFLLDRLPLSC